MKGRRRPKKKKPEPPEIIITQHAMDRANERLSLGAKSFSRMAMSAWRNGITLDESISKLKEYLLSTMDSPGREGTEIRIYGTYIYVFITNKLVTVFRCPTAYLKYIKIIKRKRKNENN